MAFRRFELTVEGTRPIILSNPCTIDTLGPHAAAIKYYTGLKKNRNEHALRRLHWLFSGYWGTEGEFVYGPDLDGDSRFDGFSDPYLPAQNLQRCIRDGATAWKLGKDTKRAIVVENDAELIYDGPKKKLMRCMPISRLCVDCSYRSWHDGGSCSHSALVCELQLAGEWMSIIGSDDTGKDP